MLALGSIVVSPGQMVDLQHVGTWPGHLRGPVQNLAVQGNYLYAAIGGYGRNLLILDVGDPAAPTRAGSFETDGTPSNVAVSGNFAYVAQIGADLTVLDVSNPTTPRRVGGYETRANGLTVVGNYAYLAYYFGLEILDVSNPAAPVRAGVYQTPGFGTAVAVTGNIAYLTDPVDGLQIIDVSKPAEPALIGRYFSGGYARDVVWQIRLCCGGGCGITCDRCE
jgi:hypothetical protein